jgi:hypothetical protein
MREPDGGSSTSNEPQDWTNSYTPVHVDVKDLGDYYFKMTTELAPRSIADTSGVLSQMGPMIDMGLVNRAASQGEVFGEGVVVAQLMMDNQAKFGAFFKDVSAGIACIGNAAGVIAEAYNDSDNFNSASLSDVAFAFNDPGATRPKDLPKGAPTKSYLDVQEEAAANAPQQPMAMSGADPVQVIYLPMGDVTYIYADHSMKTVSTRSDSNSWSSGSTTTTTYVSGGKVVGQTTQGEYTLRGGYKTQTTTQSPNDNPNAVGSSSTQVLTNPDGSMTVTTTTVGADGKPVTGDPTHVAAPSSGNTADQGPIQAAEQQYHTMGDKDYVQQHGSGY